MRGSVRAIDAAASFRSRLADGVRTSCMKASPIAGISVVGCVLCGTLAGSMLPFLLRKFGQDPASASAPFVATLVDVSGILIYFAIANLLLRGVML